MVDIQQVAADMRRNFDDTTKTVVVKKQYYTVVLLGEAQTGKSTLLGQLNYRTGSIDKRTIEGFAAEAKLIGKADSAFAWVSDQDKAERETGHTRRCHLLTLGTPKFWIAAIDAPGTRSLLRHAAAGIGHADAALLVVSAQDGKYETGIGKAGQTREHLRLACSLGIRTVIVAVNQMDTVVGQAAARYAEIRMEILDLAKKIGFVEANIVFVPVAALDAANLVIKFDAWASWYRGPTLLGALDTLLAPKLRQQQELPLIEGPEDLPANAGLRCTILDVARGTAGTATVIGRVVAGCLRPNTVLTVAPGNTAVRVEAVEWAAGPSIARDFALPGDLVRLSLCDVPASLAAGQVLSDAGANRAQGATSFIARLTVLDQPDGLRAGNQALMNVHGAEIRCEIGAILNRLDRRTNAPAAVAPDCLRNQEMGDVRIIPLDPISLDPAATHARLGRVVLRFAPPEQASEDAVEVEVEDEEPEPQRTMAAGTVMSLVAG